MAETKTDRAETAKGGQSLTRPERERSGVQRWDASFAPFASPFELFDRMSEEMDRVFDRVSRGYGLPRGSQFTRSLFGSPARGGTWTPRVEAFQKGDRFIVRAELPGLKKDEVQVELGDDALTIRGERREEHQEEREGYFHSEREYGQFHRTIPLPDGVIAESARAAFRDGVLEVTMQAAPSEVSRGRRLEIKDSVEGDPKK